MLCDRNADHLDFRQEATKLICMVHGIDPQDLPDDTDLAYENLCKKKAIKQTKVVFNEDELLHLIQRHLESRGLRHAALALKREAHLEPPTAAVTPRVLIQVSVSCF